MNTECVSVMSAWEKGFDAHQGVNLPPRFRMNDVRKIPLIPVLAKSAADVEGHLKPGSVWITYAAGIPCMQTTISHQSTSKHGQHGST